MTITGSNFIFAEESSELFGLVLCYIGSPNKDSNDEESSIVTTKNIYKETWDFHYLERTAPLQFKITVAKSNCEPFNADEQRALKKYLCKSKREWFCIDQEDLYNTYYYCMMLNPRPSNIEAFTYAWDIDVICDCGHAWTGMNNKTYISTGTASYNYNLSTDYDEYILAPYVTITPTANGSISIRNATTNKIMTINNCVTTEVIKFDCKNNKQSSSNGRILLDSWNKQYFELINGANKIELTGNFTMKIEYRLPVRVGG